MPKDRTPYDPWLEEPPSHDPTKAIQLIRTPQGGVLKFAILSDRVLYRGTHYAQGSTQPCMGPDCQWCRDRSEPRILGWIAILVERTHETCIYEMTETNAAILRTHRETHGTLRGAIVQSHRLGSKPNGRVKVQIIGTWQGHEALPEAPDVKKVLYRIWRITPETEQQNRFDQRPQLSEHERALANNGKPK